MPGLFMSTSRQEVPWTRLFFFSSRRRHTRYWRDWSSDVCSSDLLQGRVNSEVGAGWRRSRLPSCEQPVHIPDGLHRQALLRLELAVIQTIAIEPEEIGRASCRERV